MAPDATYLLGTLRWITKSKRAALAIFFTSSVVIAAMLVLSTKFTEVPTWLWAIWLFCFFYWFVGRLLEREKGKRATSAIAEIENDEMATNVLLAIKTLENEYQEDSDVLGSSICISRSEISKHINIDLGRTGYWIGKLTDVGFLKEGFGEVYGLSQSGLEFLLKRGLLK